MLAQLPPTSRARLSFFRPDRNKRLNESETTARQGKATSMLSDRSVVYCPEDLTLFGMILDQVVLSLPPDSRTPHHRAALARNIFACAATGKRDPEELRRAALMQSKAAA